MAQSGFKQVLANGGFQAFLWTQFFGAFNDNVYRSIVGLRALHEQNGRYASLVVGVFVLPSLLFSGYAGHLADAISKRRVLIAVKVFEIAVMAFGLAAFVSGRIEWMLLVVFLMGLHAAIFSPAKYGIVPEICRDEELSRANGLLEMSTFVAIVLASAVGSLLYAAWSADLWKMGLVTLAIAVAGLAVSLRITPVPASGSAEPFRLNPFAEVTTGTRHLLKDRPLWLATLGISYFWFVAALLQPDLEYFGRQVLGADDLHIGLLWTFLAVGLGAGNLLAGRLSGDKVELGLAPLGAGSMALFAMLLAVAGGSYAAAVAAVVMLALASGLFAVPLYAYVQKRSGSQEKGRIIATANFLQTLAVVLSTGLFWLCHDRWGIRPDRITFALGVLTLAVTVYVLRLVPEFFVRLVLYLLTHSVFRIRVEGREHVPYRGPALLVANHMSYVDGFLIGASVERFLRFMVWKPFFSVQPMGWFLRFMNAIPAGNASAREAVETIRAARAELAAGHAVCIFAEGAITHTGNMLPFKRGMEKIVNGMDVPIIPVHLDRVWGSIFSFEGGRFFWKWPKRIPYPVTVTFGAPMSATTPAHEVRQAIQNLSSEAISRRKTPQDTLARRLVRSARQNWGHFAMADSTGRELTYGRLLAGGVMVARWMERERVPQGMLGVLLPPSVAAALVNLGATLAGRVPVNLNFTAGRESMAAAVEQCGIRTVISSRAFLTKAKLEPLAGTVFVEDILGHAGKWQQLRALAEARLRPAAWFGRVEPDAPATVMFSSGSTGIPKGVMLSHYNLIANIEAIAQLFQVGPGDRIVGALPFFHSFGFTVTIWFPLIAGCGVVYHPNPMDAKAIGELTRRYRATLLLATPTFCTNYTRKCAREDFATLRFVLVGAEKLREPVAAAFREKFSVELLEGYGLTEMAPVVAVNAPDYGSGKERQTGTKPGSVGHPLPGVAARIVDPATFEPLAPNRDGLLLVRGSNRMLGYLNQPERTAEVLHDGWYVTGDIARIDDEGFLFITDRLSRFSKIAGEMVPHLRVEEALSAVLGDVPCAVTGIPDEQRGERLVALYVKPETGPGEVWQRLNDTDLPRLWLPKRENVYPVKELPLLGTGKLDLRGLKARALEFAAAPACRAMESGQ
jgi:acyl-[acyl-carrier-protein]-phospholipid O-acyltransferase / long-chain-fatty-acid--[acyl-carrier-protein] ligase